MKLEAWIDGACEPNPGGTASYGVVVKQEGVIIYEDAGIVGRGAKMSSNVAEYYALLRLVEWYLESQRHEEAVVYSDSQLLVNQMKGRWGVHKGLYLSYYERVTNLFTSEIFARFTFLWIDREDNQEADELSKQALSDSGVIASKSEELLDKVHEKPLLWEKIEQRLNDINAPVLIWTSEGETENGTLIVKKMDTGKALSAITEITKRFKIDLKTLGDDDEKTK